ncbi:unnamed protein product [Pleuronectes platessa]|uniref:Uncharacterized protein n=1 Tax=Pleuronectes platessa TaxID=8262 RepID=A0A9N7Z271_PLEPL|nr:unnamed protein product [Pleuronectes platessa]
MFCHLKSVSSTVSAPGTRSLLGPLGGRSLLFLNEEESVLVKRLGGGTGSRWSYRLSPGTLTVVIEPSISSVSPPPPVFYQNHKSVIASELLQRGVEFPDALTELLSLCFSFLTLYQSCSASAPRHLTAESCGCRRIRGMTGTRRRLVVGILEPRHLSCFTIEPIDFVTELMKHESRS